MRRKRGFHPTCEFPKAVLQGSPSRRNRNQRLTFIKAPFATNLVNGIRKPDGTIKALTPRQVADLLGHTTSQITEMYYVKKDTARLSGITDDFNI